MIDIHAHILPFVDDGSDSIEQSLEMLRAEIEAGVTDVICTPHYRFDFMPDKESVLSSFEMLTQAVKDNGLNINLYLGQEIFVDRDIRELLREQKVFSLNNGKYILVEFDLMFKRNIPETIYELKRLGYIPIVAHIERYFYVNIETCFEVKRYGGLIQVNASSIVGREKRSYAKLIKKLFKFGLVDFVSSDTHHNRENLMANSYARVKKKFGVMADKTFTDNAVKIIKG